MGRPPPRLCLPETRRHARKHDVSGGRSLAVARHVAGVRGPRVPRRRGTLHVGFQSARAFRRQTAVYEHLATETDLSIHVYVDASWDVPSLDGVAVHAEDADEIGRFWIVAFDGAGDDDAKCGLLATETAPGAFDGIWAYDPDLIDDVDAYLRKTYVG
ncbi:DICT sensory domain-containing protein [Haloarculaceae archaeon H-GB2-1]|nr:DICT sensory domain-containing protein [Haloarculaceae archaeon H-GB11]MEA5407127.1 DICT sensory domain-containing protein [Haloarculaceae archaeon H-GB2-1]